MAPTRSQADLERFRHVLAGLTYPAAKWQLVIHAEDYGADAATRSELWTLPAGTYDSLREVLLALGFRAPAPRPGGFTAAPSPQAASRDEG